MLYVYYCWSVNFWDRPETTLLFFYRFFTYGDLPLEQHLKQIEEEALSKFEQIDPKTDVPSQPLWSSPVSPHCAHSLRSGFDNT